MIKKDAKILVLGGTGLVGSGLVRALERNEFQNICAPSRKEVNLLNQEETVDYFLKNKFDYVFMAAAKVGGIYANTQLPADFLFQNLGIQNNVFEGCYKSKVHRLLFLGSSCIYPKLCPMPIKEEYLLTGPLEETNEFYAIAKIAGLKMVEAFNRQYETDYVALMPTNLYGPNDNFHPTQGHVLPGLIARMSEAKKNGETKFKIWGTGTPRRELLYIDDLADACLFVMAQEKLPYYYLNVGTGMDISIKELAQKVAKAVGYDGELTFDPNFPDGTPRKVLNVDRIKQMGWEAKVSLDDGIDRSIEYYRSHHQTD